MALIAGTQLGPYEIQEAIGAGGMGEVYRALDPRLNRAVAIKILPEHFSGHEEARLRFEREARAVAALSHPHVLAIFDFGFDKGIWYSVTELLEGETLRARLSRGTIPWREAVEMAREAAEGLHSAHTKGVIHRDVKPENIFLTAEGHVKLLDFGLARLEPAGRAEIAGVAQSDLTQDGAIVGTYSYMSPEQVLGENIQARCDLFSLGCVLFEMLSGIRPFLRDTGYETLEAILHDDPPPISAVLVPPQLAHVILRCLQKDPEGRYSSAQELALALKSVDRSGALPSLLHQRRSIAVLPFTDMSPERDQEYFCDGIAEELIHALSQSGNVQVTSRTSAFQFKQKMLDIRWIGQQLNVATIVEGSVRKEANRLRVTAELINVSNGYQIWSGKFDREATDIFNIQEEIAAAIADKLRIPLHDLSQPLVKRYTEDLEAYHLYLKGRHFWARRYQAGLGKAMEHFRGAIERDSAYAPAYAGLADSYTILGSYGFLPPAVAFPQAEAAAEKALQLDGTLPEAHVAQALIRFWYGWNWTEAENGFRTAIELNPSDSLAHIWYGNLLSMIGRCEEAVEELRRAQRLDPLSPLVNSLAGCIFYMARSYDDALLEFQKVFDVDPDFLVALSFAGGVYLQKAMFGEAKEITERALQVSSRSSFCLAAMGALLGVEGRTREAQSILLELKERARDQYVPPFYSAMVSIGMNDADSAFAYLEQAYGDRNIQMCFLKCSPGLDSLRSDPRFAELLQRVGF